MKRDIKKLLEEYKKLDNKKRYTFYASDFFAIKDEAVKEGSEIFNMINVALRYGFMVGYKAGLKDGKEKERKKQERAK